MGHGHSNGCLYGEKDYTQKSVKRPNSENTSDSFEHKNNISYSLNDKEKEKESVPNKFNEKNNPMEFSFENTCPDIPLNVLGSKKYNDYQKKSKSFHKKVMNAKKEFNEHASLNPKPTFMGMLIPVLDTPFNLHSALKMLDITEKELYEIANHNLVNMYYKAIETCPAYRQFIEEHNIEIKKWSDIPPTSKENYIKKFPMNELYKDGRIPIGMGCQTDTSTGTSGIPTQWNRCKPELDYIENMLILTADVVFGFNKDVTLINMFALGKYATGMTVSRTMKDRCYIFNSGPDYDAVIRFIEITEIEREHSGYETGTYILAGYPPHMLELVELARKRGIDLAKLNVFIVCGGETMSIHVRQMIEEYGVKMVISTYGASDLDINVAGQNIFDKVLGDVIKKDPELLIALCGESVKGKGVPSVFHFNPLYYYIHNDEKGNLYFTAQNDKRASSRIEYSPGDIGFVCKASKLRETLKRFGYDDLLQLQNNSPFPTLFLWGRYGTQITFNGANVLPQNLDAALNREESFELKQIIRYIAYQADPDTNGLLSIWIELKSDVDLENISENDCEKFRDIILEGMCIDNGDLAWQIDACKRSKSDLPSLKIFKYNQSPMKHDPHRKREYIYYMDNNQLKETELLPLLVIS